MVDGIVLWQGSEGQRDGGRDDGLDQGDMLLQRETLQVKHSAACHYSEPTRSKEWSGIRWLQILRRVACSTKSMNPSNKCVDGEGNMFWGTVQSKAETDLEQPVQWSIE